MCWVRLELAEKGKRVRESREDQRSSAVETGPSPRGLARPRSGQVKPSSHTILVADADARTRYELAYALRGAGFQTLQADSELSRGNLKRYRACSASPNLRGDNVAPHLAPYRRPSVAAGVRPIAFGQGLDEPLHAARLDPWRELSAIGLSEPDAQHIQVVNAPPSILA